MRLPTEDAKYLSRPRGLQNSSAGVCHWLLLSFSFWAALKCELTHFISLFLSLSPGVFLGCCNLCGAVDLYVRRSVQCEAGLALQDDMRACWLVRADQLRHHQL